MWDYSRQVKKGKCAARCEIPERGFSRTGEADMQLQIQWESDEEQL